MDTNTTKLINMLDNVIRISNTLLSSELLDALDGDKMIRTLKGIRNRFFLEEYKTKSPKGFLIDEIDESLLPLDRLLLEAGKKRYKHTIACILDAIIYGTGICHRILTLEEQKEEAYTLMKRKNKLDEYFDKICTAKELDKKIQERQNAEGQQIVLQKNAMAYQKKIDYFQQYKKNVKEELRYYTAMEDMSMDAQEYIQLNVVLNKIRDSMKKNEEAMECIDMQILHYQNVLRTKIQDISVQVEIQEEAERVKAEEEAKQLEAKKEEVEEKTLPEKDSKLKVEKETEKVINISDDKAAKNWDEQAIEEKIEELQKIAQKFIDEDGPNMIDLEYEAMNKIFSSQEMKDYVAKSVYEFEAYGLAERINRKPKMTEEKENGDTKR